VQVAVVGADNAEFNEHVLEVLRRGALLPDGEKVPFGRAELQTGQHHKGRVAGSLGHPVAPAGRVVSVTAIAWSPAAIAASTISRGSLAP
jgi:hypothetical protein